MMELVRQGFDVVNVVPNRENPDFNVFMFEDSEELYKALNVKSK